MLEEFILSAVFVALSEICDKTQITLMLLSSKTKKHKELLLSAMLAFLIVDGIGIFFGSLLREFFIKELIRVFSAIIFILFGAFILIDSKFKKFVVDKAINKNPFTIGFSMIFLAEFGDKTQILSGILAMNYAPLMVFFGALTALFFLSLIAIYLSKNFICKFNEGKISKISGIIFIAFGISFILFI
ncbi:MAG: TMEM165/GDT1 family protein [Candidatus Altiarchaeota archaeon]